jgi:hypothetical protein
VCVLFEWDMLILVKAGKIDTQSGQNTLAVVKMHTRKSTRVCVCVCVCARARWWGDAGGRGCLGLCSDGGQCTLSSCCSRFNLVGGGVMGCLVLAEDTDIGDVVL